MRGTGLPPSALGRHEPVGQHVERGAGVAVGKRSSGIRGAGRATQLRPRRRGPLWRLWRSSFAFASSSASHGDRILILAAASAVSAAVASNPPVARGGEERRGDVGGGRRRPHATGAAASEAAVVPRRAAGKTNQPTWEDVSNTHRTSTHTALSMPADPGQKGAVPCAWVGGRVCVCVRPSADPKTLPVSCGTWNPWVSEWFIRAVSKVATVGLVCILCRRLHPSGFARVRGSPSAHRGRLSQCSSTSVVSHL